MAQFDNIKDLHNYFKKQMSEVEDDWNKNHSSTSKWKSKVLTKRKDYTIAEAEEQVIKYFQIEVQTVLNRRPSNSYRRTGTLVDFRHWAKIKLNDENGKYRVIPMYKTRGFKTSKPTSPEDGLNPEFVKMYPTLAKKALTTKEHYKQARTGGEKKAQSYTNLFGKKYSNYHVPLLVEKGFHSKGVKPNPQSKKMHIPRPDVVIEGRPYLAEALRKARNFMHKMNKQGLIDSDEIRPEDMQQIFRHAKAEMEDFLKGYGLPID